MKISDEAHKSEMIARRQRQLKRVGPHHAAESTFTKHSAPLTPFDRERIVAAAMKRQFRAMKIGA